MSRLTAARPLKWSDTTNNFTLELDCSGLEASEDDVAHISAQTHLLHAPACAVREFRAPSSATPRQSPAPLPRDYGMRGVGAWLSHE